MTRNEAREAFKSAGLTYSVLTRGNVARLRDIIGGELQRSGLIRGTYKVRSMSVSRDGTYAEVTCRTYYFSKREAVTFNPDGFIGLAGWADDENATPIIAGFIKWVAEMKGASA